MSNFPASCSRGQVVHAAERVGVVGTELGLLERQRLLAERQGLSSCPAAW